jgi:16S rRNA (cytosine1402-N4)-methyltransferase
MTDEPHYFHRPVLLDFLDREVFRETDKVYVDCTLGEGGHAAHFLKRGLKVYGLDRDPEILKIAGARLAPLGDFTGVHLNYGKSAEWFAQIAGQYDWVLFDLGISMFHYRGSGRGFSFSQDEALDMRLDEGGLSAADLVNTLEEKELADLFYNLGGEKQSRRMAWRIVHEREKKPITTSKELADMMLRFGKAENKVHPATRIFQALRIEVNHELDHIESGLRAAAENLRVGGRIAVMSYHSLEDRIVKNYFRELTGKKMKVNRYRETADDRPWKDLFPKPVEADLEETRNNAAARSAKLRIVERCF